MIIVDNLTVYLKPTPAIDADNQVIVALARNITQNCSSQQEILRELFYFVRDECQYNMYSPFEEKDNQASEILHRGYGNCLQKAILLPRCRAIFLGE